MMEVTVEVKSEITMRDLNSGFRSVNAICRIYGKGSESLNGVKIKAVCHEDFTLKPKLGSKSYAYYPDVFFINATKNIIFFIYDDRGCEVVAKKQGNHTPFV